jgi:tetratricopeptide (TPR) repeat protein
VQHGWALLFCLLLPAVSFCTQAESTSLAAQAAAARDANRLDDAAALYDKVLALDPGWKEGWWSLGTIRYDRNLYSQAAQAFRKLAEIDSKSGSARVMLGLCEFEMHQDEAALRDIQEGENIGVLDNQQLRNVALFHEGVLLQRAGRFEAAQRAFVSLCIAGTDNPELEDSFGMTVLLMRNRAAPPDPPASGVIRRVGAAECLASQKKFDQARIAYQAVEHDYPDFPNLHYAFGRFLLNAHDTPGGIAELEQEIKRSPTHALARLQIAAAKYKIDSAGGLPYAQAAVNIDSRLPLAHYLYGLLLLDTDDYGHAIPELEQAERGMPRMPAVYSALAAAYSRAGRREDAARARAAFQRYKNGPSDSTSAAPQP